MYDQGGEQALKEGGGPGGGFHNPMDIFDMFFGTHSHNKSREVGKDMVHQLKVTDSAYWTGVELFISSVKV